MGAISGKYAEVRIGSCEFMEFESWSMTIGPEIHKIATRSGGHWRRAVTGVSDGSGTITGYLDPDSPFVNAFQQGVLLDLILRVTPTGPVQFSGRGMIGQVDVTASREGEPVPLSFTFEVDGPFLFPGES